MSIWAPWADPDGGSAAQPPRGYVDDLRTPGLNGAAPHVRCAARWPMRASPASTPARPSPKPGVIAVPTVADRPCPAAAGPAKPDEARRRPAAVGRAPAGGRARCASSVSRSGGDDGWRLPGRGRADLTTVGLRAAAGGAGPRPLSPTKSCCSLPPTPTSASRRPCPPTTPVRRPRWSSSGTSSTSGSLASRRRGGQRRPPRERQGDRLGQLAEREGEPLTWPAPARRAEQSRVVAPDVARGSAPRSASTGDTITIAWAARKLGRRAALGRDPQREPGRDEPRPSQPQHIKIAAAATAASSPTASTSSRTSGPTRASVLPFFTCLMAPGVYDIPDVHAGFRQAVTNMTPIAAYRGAWPRPRRPSSARSTCSPPRSAWTRRRSGGATSSPRQLPLPDQDGDVRHWPRSTPAHMSRRCGRRCWITGCARTASSVTA